MRVTLSCWINIMKKCLDMPIGIIVPWVTVGTVLGMVAPCEIPTGSYLEASRLSAIHGILAIVAFLECSFYPFFPPYSIIRLFSVLLKVLVPFANISVYCSLAFIDGLIIAVMNDGSGHPAEYRLDDVHKLRACRKRCELHERRSFLRSVFLAIYHVDLPVELLGCGYGIQEK